MAKKRTYREFRQGIYKPLNPDKCLNKTPIVFRSFLEARLFKIIDTNPDIIKWSSEQVIVPYVHPIKSKQEGRQVFARYFVDIYIEIKIGDKTKKIIAEIKPHSQTQAPKSSNRKKASTILYENSMYAINTAKWTAAQAYAKNKNMEFIIITENNIDLIEGKK